MILLVSLDENHYPKKKKKGGGGGGGGLAQLNFSQG